MESYRTERGPRQRMVAYLGWLDEEGCLGVLQAAAPETQKPTRKSRLPFSQQASPNDSDEPQPRWVTVNASAVRVENCLQFGGPGLAFVEHALKIRKHIGNLNPLENQHNSNMIFPVLG